MADDGYVCPNGHVVPAVRVHNCQTCHASVVYEPAAHGMALRVRAEKAEAGVARVLDAMEADAQRQLDAGEAPFVAQADLDAIDRVRGLLGP
jgi:hypothetical protein